MNKTDHSSDAHEARSAYAKAAKAELAQNYDLAFRLYVKAAELYLHLSRTSKGQDKDAAKWEADKAVQRAEKIKAFIERKDAPSAGPALLNDPSITTPYPKMNLTPVGIDYFSTQEQFYILKKGSSVNGLIFSLWDEPVTYGGTSSGLYQDPDGQPKLSPEQAKVSPVWRRATVDNAPGPYQRVLPQEILQHIVTDCSVCASISVCLEYARRFGSNFAETAVYDSRVRSEPGTRAIGHHGRYDIKIFFNGAWRLVDDMLPYHPVEGTLMCMSVLSSDRRQPVIWPSILEKGYMKLLGGYDFPGSNSSIDLHAIAGWIPEHLKIKGSSFEREKTWEKIVAGFSNGHCMLTLGTGPSSNIFWQNMELLPSHSYAVIDVIEKEGTRILTVLDTWVNPNHENQLRQQARMLHIPWSDVLNDFDGIYLSWNPLIWPRVLNSHGMWKRKGQDEQSSTRQVYLKYDTKYKGSEQEIWVLLTRHISNSSRQSDFISLKVEVEDELKNNSNIIDQTAIAAKGTYTNSTHVLVRTKVLASQPSGVLSIFTSYDGDSTEVTFTLAVYAGADMTIAWDEKVPTPPFTKKLEGSLTNKNAGGNCTYPTFMLNPQYHLKIYPIRNTRSSKAKVTLTLQSSRDIPINVSLVWSQGSRIDELIAKELVASSGAYNYGLARVTKEVSAGDYTVIISAFEPHHMGTFSLKIDSSQSFDIKAIPQEDAGMYTKVIRGAWNSRTAMGGPTSTRYSKNPIFEIEVPEPTRLKIRLQLLRPSTATSLNLTIFPPSSDGSLRHHITTSGAYSDTICGVVTPQILLNAGKYWAVPSTYNPGVEVGFQLLLYTSLSSVKIIERGR